MTLWWHIHQPLLSIKLQISPLVCQGLNLPQVDYLILPKTPPTHRFQHRLASSESRPFFGCPPNAPITHQSNIYTTVSSEKLTNTFRITFQKSSQDLSWPFSTSCTSKKRNDFAQSKRKARVSQPTASWTTLKVASRVTIKHSTTSFGEKLKGRNRTNQQTSI